MKTRTPLRILLATVVTLALLPMLSSVSPVSLLTVSPASADQIWYQSTGRTRAKACATGGGAAGTCVIGARGPGGGIVFYVNKAAATGSRYMEVAPRGWNTGADPDLEWGVNSGVDCSTLIIPGAARMAIGAGLANTTAITAACTTVQAPAAWAAKNYTGGGLPVGSWFLPSIFELNQLCRYASRQPFNAAKTTCTGSRSSRGGFAATGYWSSSQFGPWGDAWFQYFGVGGGFQYFERDGTLGVRPVRAF